MFISAAAGGGETGKAGKPGLRPLVEALLFLLFTIAIFQFPEHPATGVDPSWKMAMGRTFHDGRQFGIEVVYNYGPLGFLMANTYSGLQFRSLILWQFFAAIVFSAVIIRNARNLHWIAYTMYMAVFLFYGIIYPDALYMIAIALMGLELVRREEWRWATSSFFALFFAAVSLMKFTNMVFALFVTSAIVAYRCWRGRWVEGAWFAVWCCGGGLAFWILCRQSPANFPAYLRNSWQISRGYEEAMGTPASPWVLWKAVAVLAILGIYMLLHACLQRNKPRAIASLGILAVFIFLDWKHGFVRADAHMLVFFVSALVPVISFPALMDDPSRLRWLQRGLLLCAGVLCVLAVHDIMRDEEVDPPYVRADLQESIGDNLTGLFHWRSFREGYTAALREQKESNDLPLMWRIIGRGTVDMIGNDQSMILLNGFCYSPRPVFQSFAAYNGCLEKLNYDFYTSARAPDFVLMKVQALDDRLAALDDALVLRLLPHCYELMDVREHGCLLWKRRDRLSNPVEPGLRALLSKDVAINAPFPLGDISAKNLWVTIDVHPSLEGRLRRFCYKPAVVSLVLGGVDGANHTYSLPLSQASTGFIFNPIIENNDDYLALAKGEAGRRVQSLEVEVADEDQCFYTGPAHVEFFELP